MRRTSAAAPRRRWPRNLAAARDYYERALELREGSRGATHPSTAYPVNGLGDLVQAESDFETAAAFHRRALEIRESRLGDDHPLTAFSLTGLGLALSSHGKPGEAVELLEQALRIRTASPVAAELLAKTRFALARALVDASPTDTSAHNRALELAELARAGFAKGGVVSAAELVAADAWILDHAE